MDMNEQLISNLHQVLVYEHKAGTNSSYYLREGKKNLLPERIGYSQIGFLKIQQKGRALKEIKKGQIVGSFKKSESSPYKQNKPFRIFSSVWKAQQYPSFVGYGDIGISGIEGKIQSSMDLFILYKPSPNIMELHLFVGLMDYKDEVLEYLDRHIKKQTLEKAC